jgi:hypothetical protein
MGKRDRHVREVFSGLTLVVTTGDGLPNLGGSYTTPPKFAGDCTHPSMDCAAEATILSYFIESSVGGNNGKATQTSGMKAWRVGLNMGIGGVRSLSQDTMTQQSASTRILGGGQFATRFSKDPVGEGCTSKFPPDGYEGNADAVPVTLIPAACTTTDLTKTTYTTYGQVKKNAPSDLISPEQAAYNVLWFYFDGTPAATIFGGTWGSAPLNYLQIYSDDIYYAINTTSPATIVESGTPTSVTAQSLLNQASTQVSAIAEAKPYCPSGTSCPSWP